MAQIGDNTTTGRKVPTAVSGGDTWKQVAAGDSYTCGIKSDDTLWCWGYNWKGQIGDNTTASRKVPTSVSGGTWKQVTTGDSHTCGIKPDDTLWCWGYNGYGQIGDNTSGTDRLVPVSTVCGSPVGTAGAFLYNGDLAILQYCNGVSWVGVGK